MDSKPNQRNSLHGKRDKSQEHCSNRPYPGGHLPWAFISFSLPGKLVNKMQTLKNPTPVRFYFILINGKYN